MALPRLVGQDLGDLGRIAEGGPDVGSERDDRRDGLVTRGRRGIVGGDGRRCGGGSGGRRQLGADNAQHLLGHIGVGEHQRGVRQHRPRPRRQQARISRP